jgi:hypothetical protein
MVIERRICVRQREFERAALDHRGGVLVVWRRNGVPG